MAKRRMTNNGQQNITHKTKDWATRTPLQSGVNSCAPRVAPVVLQTRLCHEGGKDSCNYDKRNIYVVICDTGIQ
jgi:hypothetical protein